MGLLVRRYTEAVIRINYAPTKDSEKYVVGLCAS
jgi:hypothetical protein